MFDVHLAPPGTVVTGKGHSEPFQLASDAPLYLLTASITRTVEQEALRIYIWDSSEGVNWSPAPLLEFPELFYAGDYPILLHAQGLPRPRMIRATWEAHRWGRGPESPMFEFELRMREVPAELAREIGVPRK